MLRILSAGTVVIILSLSTTAFAAGELWSCVKGGKVIVVKGDTPEKKKKNCENAKGKWSEEKPKQETSGGGGGW